MFAIKPYPDLSCYDTTIWQRLVRGEKYSRWRGPREPHENFSNADKIWFTVGFNVMFGLTLVQSEHSRLQCSLLLFIFFFDLHSIFLDILACTTCAQVLHGSFPFSCRLRFNFECFLGVTDCPDLTHLYSGITILAMLLTRMFVVLFLHFSEGANYLIIIMVNS